MDMQYMLGDSLLAAPVFSETGQVEYYLPKGKWYNLMTEETLEGPGWQIGKFDYHSMPLLVPGNTILPLGSCKDKPDYDYTKGVTLLLTEFDDGARSSIFIPDTRGNKVMFAEAIREGNKITVSVRGSSDYTCAASWNRAAEMVREEGKTIIFV